jgi:hypothetical protein
MDMRFVMLLIVKEKYPDDDYGAPSRLCSIKRLCHLPLAMVSLSCDSHAILGFMLFLAQSTK